MQIKTYRNGHASIEKLSPSGMYLVICRVGDDVRDRVRCDDYCTARKYFRAFCAIARNA